MIANIFFLYFIFLLKLFQTTDISLSEENNKIKQK